ncbi:MAG TPA: hypothetical protein VHC22_05960 [Pirellulales bacterium]|nr:hypothetical protein [Pirellulales bacterium]
MADPYTCVPWLWSYFFGFSLVLLAAVAVLSIRRAGGTTGHVFKWALVFGLVVLTVKAAKWPWDTGWTEDQLAVLRAVILLTGGSLVAWCLSSVVLTSTSNARSSDRSVRWTLFLIVEGTWLLTMSSAHIDRGTHVTEFDEARVSAGDIKDGDLVEIGDAHLVTDTGRAVPVYRVSHSWMERAKAAGANPEQSTCFSHSVICQAPGDAQSNCHGWVFAGGRYIVRETAVEQILSDNGYLRVDRPQANDVIVYRSEVDGKVMHTGVVKFVDQDQVLIESKWGLWGRYLHAPQHQPYSKRFAYFHSPRTGNRLTESRPAQAVTLQLPPRQAVRRKRIQLWCMIPSTSLSL